MKHLGRLILRLGLGIVFLYFGINQIVNPERWINLLPDFLLTQFSPHAFIYLNGIFDVLIGLGFVFGIFIRIVSILGFIHLLGISLFILGINSPSGIRDLGLAFSSLSLFFLKD